MKRSNASKILMSLGLAGVLLGAASIAQASAFQIWEQDAAGIGDYHAGAAAEANTAATEFYNPAGLTRLGHQQLSLGATSISTLVRFTGTVAGAQGQANGGVLKFIPNLHYALPINDNWAFGFGITVPFGLETDYPSSSVAANYSTKTSLETINLNPSIAYKINSHLSLGFGLDAQYLTADFDNFVADQIKDKNSGNSWGYGWNMGLLLQMNKNTRFGFSYRSQIRQHLKGTGTVTDTSLTPPIDAKSDNLKANLTMPATTMLGAFHRFKCGWSILGNVTYTQWSVFKNLTLTNLPTAGGVLPSFMTVPQNFKDTWNFAFGAHYRFNSRWTLKLGTGYDITPTNTKDRNLRMPDANRYALAAGGEYRFNKSFAVDAGYMHLFIDKAKINNTPTDPNLAPSNGHVKSLANIYGVQVIWTV
jgi:long-chain fatty acid transport protein